MNLSDPKALKAFLGTHGIRAEKGLGQHFLCSSSVVEAIVASVASAKGILEIGPGPGVLTSVLSEKAERLIAVEVDLRMVELLKVSAPLALVRQEDALKADLAGLLAELPQPRAVVGNLPYYITGPLLTKIAEARGHFGKAVVMIQKEVAERVTAVPGDSNRGSLSVYLQSQFRIGVVRQAPAGAFVPPPKVDSTVLELNTLPSEPSEAFFRLVRLAFAQPRKTLLNNLVAGYRVDRSTAAEWLSDAGLEENIRPHMLTILQWNSLVGFTPKL